MDSMSNQSNVESEVEKMINRVREFRENKLMTQAQLARKAKVALRTIHSVEKGMNCRMDTKRKIPLALGLHIRKMMKSLSNPSGPWLHIRNMMKSLSNPSGPGLHIRKMNEILK